LFQVGNGRVSRPQSIRFHLQLFLFFQPHHVASGPVNALDLVRG
jgi:hypothetical protein